MQSKLAIMFHLLNHSSLDSHRSTLNLGVLLKAILQKTMNEISLRYCLTSHSLCQRNTFNVSEMLTCKPVDFLKIHHEILLYLKFPISSITVAITITQDKTMFCYYNKNGWTYRRGKQEAVRTLCFEKALCKFEYQTKMQGHQVAVWG